MFDFLKPKPTPERFGKDVLDRLKRVGAPAAITFDPTTFAIDLGKDGGIFNLHNAYRTYVDAPASERSGELDKAVTFAWEMLHRPDNSWEVVQPMLLPIIRARGMLESDWLYHPGAKPGSYTGAYRPLGEALAILVAVDRPMSIQLAATSQYEEWGHGFEEALAIATENLRAVSPSKFWRADAGFYVSDYGDHHDSSRLLLPHLFDQLDLNGDPVIVPMARNALLVTGSRDAGPLQAMADFVSENLFNEQRPLAFLPLILRHDSAWEVASGLSPELDRLIVNQSLWDHQEQTPLLQKHLGEDVFVATFSVITHEDGKVFSYAVWPLDAPTWLPRTDVLMVQTLPDEKLGLVRRWEDVEAVCGPFRADPNCYPPRFVTPDSITPEQAARLRNEFAEPEGWPSPKA